MCNLTVLDTLRCPIHGVISVLGDGCINVNYKFMMSQREDRLEWLKYIQREFKEHNINSTIWFRRTGGFPNSRPSFVLQTQRYLLFKSERERWYPTGKKQLPLDIRITPKSLAHFYMGDGSLVQYQLRLYTDAFSLEEVRYLRSRIDDLYEIPFYIRSKPNGRYFLEITRKKLVQYFLALIKPYILSCFSYKCVPGTRYYRKDSSRPFYVRILE